jgi:hypothetical protein
MQAVFTFLLLSHQPAVIFPSGMLAENSTNGLLCSVLDQGDRLEHADAGPVRKG